VLGLSEELLVQLKTKVQELVKQMDGITDEALRLQAEGIDDTWDSGSLREW
jgi:hypothetical protein